jgi:hypothetical protein
MLIRQTRVLNVAKHIEPVPHDSEFRLAIGVTATIEPKLMKLGFPEALAAGDTILPAAVGPVSRFNAHGKWDVHKDQPKESRYIRTVQWRWHQWAGRHHYEEHEDFRDIYRDCYPRDLLPPPAVELTYVEQNGRRLVISPAYKNRPEEYECIGHGINLFLELFGACELVSADLDPFQGLQVKRVNWRMLPPGEHPWERLREHLDGILSRQSENTRNVIFDRQETMKAHAPDSIYVGLGGFSDYLAYSFRSLGLVVLESIRRDNAIYVFGRDWERFARLTKAQVLSGGHHNARIIHAKGWKSRLAELLCKPKAA